MASSVREVTKQGKRVTLSLLSTTVAATALVSAPPAVSAQTTAATCGATAKLPYYHNRRVYGQGIAWCNNSQPSIGMQVAILRDGRQMASGTCKA
jgi:hypothetical protein